MSALLKSSQAQGVFIDVNKTDPLTGNTALIGAASEVHLKIVDLLLKYDANLEVVNNEGLTALAVAARQGHREIMEGLIAKGANINFSSPMITDKSQGDSVLMHAVMAQQLEVVKLLVMNPQLDINFANKVIFFIGNFQNKECIRIK